jgi:hypothetical protein
MSRNNKRKRTQILDIDIDAIEKQLQPDFVEETRCTFKNK